MKTLITRVIGLFLVMSAYAQQGDFWISHHYPKIQNLDAVNFDIDFTQQGLLISANKSGVLQYDGQYWDFYKTPGAALSVTSDSIGVIYVGCVGDYGKIDVVKGEVRFLSLAISQDLEEVFFQAEYQDGFVYFLSGDRLIAWDIAHSKHIVLLNDTIQMGLENLFFGKEGLMLQTTFEGNFVIHADSIRPIDFITPDGSQVLFIEKHPYLDFHLVGTVNNNLYIHVDSGFQRLAVSDYLIENRIDVIEGEWIGLNLFGTSTLEDGVLVFDYIDDRLVNTVDYNKGLPDNEIFAIQADMENGLWISHDFGLSRIAPELPILSFSNYPGLEGNLVAAKRIKDTLFVTTSQGAFYLHQERKFKTTAYYVKRRNPTDQVQVSSKKKSATRLEKVVEPEEGETRRNNKRSKKKRVAGFLKKDKKKEKERKTKLGKVLSNMGNVAKEVLSDVGDAISDAATTVAEKTSESAKKVAGKITEVGGGKKLVGKPKPYQYVRKTKKELVSERFLYRAVDGLQAKVKDIFELNDRVIVVTNSGIYEVTAGVATLVIEEPTRLAYPIEEKNQLIVSTLENSVLVYEYVGEVWALVKILPVFNESILSVYLDSHQQVWLAGTSYLYKTDTSFQREMISFPFENQYLDEVRLLEVDDTLQLIGKQGYFYFDVEQDTVLENTGLTSRLARPVKHIQQPDGSVWVFDGKLWHRLEHNGQTTVFGHLSLFPDMEYAMQSGDTLWLVKGGNNLLRYVNDPTDSVQGTGQMFFKSIKDTKGNLGNSADITLTYDNNTLHFTLSRPDYLGLLNVEYQYLMKGLGNKWSNWSNDNSLEFDYLPSGQYTLHVKSRDAFGRVQESRPFRFKITPPYWETTWFYAAQVIFFVILVIVSAQMNRRHTMRSNLVTEGLTLITIVFIIELLQNVAQGWFGNVTNPVTAFSIDVGTALLVFPLEVLLRKFVKNELKMSDMPGFTKSKLAGSRE